MNAQSLEELADAYAFLGNSLLRPMTQTADVGLDSAFWAAFPSFGDDRIAQAVADLASWARSREDVPRSQLVERVAVEHTRLFVGPPKPAAPPWETMGRREDVTVGFGDPTFEMRALLRGLGLELSNDNRQYEDHIGIELLYLSELCRRAAEASGVSGGLVAPVAPAASVGSEAAPAKAAASGDGVPWESAAIAMFLDEHPLGWVGALASRAEAAAPDGYVPLVIRLAEAVMQAQRRALAG